jgi:hypothetical protein
MIEPNSDICLYMVRQFVDRILNSGTRIEFNRLENIKSICDYVRAQIEKEKARVAADMKIQYDQMKIQCDQQYDQMKAQYDHQYDQMKAQLKVQHDQMKVQYDRIVEDLQDTLDIAGQENEQLQNEQIFANRNAASPVPGNPGSMASTTGIAAVLQHGTSSSPVANKNLSREFAAL